MRKGRRFGVGLKTKEKLSQYLLFFSLSGHRLSVVDLFTTEYKQSATAAFWRTFHLDGKITPDW
jgi:hypothetical protein